MADRNIATLASSRLSAGITATAIAAALLLSCNSAVAQLTDQLKGAMGSPPGSSGALGGLGSSLGGGGMPSVGQATPSNTAGVLQYCIRNNYVSGGAASSVKNSIVSKVTGAGGSADDGGFKAGNNGLLQTGSGPGYSLGGSGLKAQATQKICGMVLQHAKSFL